MTEQQSMLKNTQDLDEQNFQGEVIQENRRDIG